jgi:hypothetical protein
MEKKMVSSLDGRDTAPEKKKEHKSGDEWNWQPYEKGEIVSYDHNIYKAKWNTDKNNIPIDYIRAGDRDFGLSWLLVGTLNKK